MNGTADRRPDLFGICTTTAIDCTALPAKLPTLPRVRRSRFRQAADMRNVVPHLEPCGFSPGVRFRATTRTDAEIKSATEIMLVGAVHVGSAHRGLLALASVRIPLGLPRCSGCKRRSAVGVHGVLCVRRPTAITQSSPKTMLQSRGRRAGSVEGMVHQRCGFNTS